MRHGNKWPKGLWLTGALAATSCIATFLLEYFHTSLSGNAGTAGFFNIILALDILLIAIWYGWIGVYMCRGTGQVTKNAPDTQT
jgi:hypothetical protein